MRRKDREVKEFSQIVEIIKGCDCIRLGFSDVEYPYIVPLNFGYSIEGEQIKFYIHGALDGKKCELIKKNKKCFFEMDCDHKLELLPEKKDVTMRYKSLMGTADIELLDENKKEKAMDCYIMGRYKETANFEYDKSILKRTMIAELKVTSYSGKVNEK